MLIKISKIISISLAQVCEELSVFTFFSVLVGFLIISWLWFILLSLSPSENDKNFFKATDLKEIIGSRNFLSLFFIFVFFIPNKFWVFNRGVIFLSFALGLSISIFPKLHVLLLIYIIQVMMVFTSFIFAFFYKTFKRFRNFFVSNVFFENEKLADSFLTYCFGNTIKGSIKQIGSLTGGTLAGMGLMHTKHLEDEQIVEQSESLVNKRQKNLNVVFTGARLESERQGALEFVYKNGTWPATSIYRGVCYLVFGESPNTCTLPEDFPPFPPNGGVVPQQPPFPPSSFPQPELNQYPTAGNRNEDISRNFDFKTRVDNIDDAQISYFESKKVNAHINQIPNIPANPIQNPDNSSIPSNSSPILPDLGSEEIKEYKGLAGEPLNEIGKTVWGTKKK